MEAQYAALYPELYRRHWWWRVRERMLLATLRRLVPAPPVRILDVGCGGGLFFEALQQFGDITGIEADATSVERGNPWADRIICGELDESFTPSAPFDLILMLDVLEHVPNSSKLLDNAARIVANGGRIVVTVPAFQWLWTGHDDMNHHVKRYTARDLTAALRGAGLTVFETRYLFQSLMLPKLAVRISENIGLRRPDLPGIPGPTISAALQAWCWIEYKLFGKLPFGTSVMAVAGRR
jgi:2-polyprenyl-3-methyl-5-hydroxy-6-metoxy-1,4-benzoquinol methylase